MKKIIKPGVDMKYTTFIFDFDYTLADATDGIVASANYALKKLNLEPKSRDDIRSTVGLTLRETFLRLTEISDKQSAEQFVSFFKESADEVMTDNTYMLDDTISTLTKLKQMNCKTAIVTSKLHYRIDDVLRKYAITELVDYIVGFEDVDIPKPSPEGLQKVIKYFGARERSVLYVGDSLTDANTAKNASIDFAAVTTGTTTRQDFILLPHIHIAKNLTELMTMVNKTN